MTPCHRASPEAQTVEMTLRLALKTCYTISAYFIQESKQPHLVVSDEYFLKDAMFYLEQIEINGSPWL